MAEEPISDDKDWTWVLEKLCPECRYDVRHFPREEVSSLIRANAARWIPVLALDEKLLRQRPRPDRWSALEYAAHVRDVFALYDYRLALMLAEDAPHYPNWDQDETARTENYSAADPTTVATELTANAERLAARFDTITGSQWERTGFRSDGAAFTVETFARYLIHDPEHHYWDVDTGLAQIAEQGG